MNYKKRDRKSIRYPLFDYTSEGYYFITICETCRVTACYDPNDRQCIYNIPGSLSFINGSEVNKTEIGEIIEKCWLDIPKHFNHASLDEYIVMPNHFHGIIYLSSAGRDTVCDKPTNIYDYHEGRDTACRVPTTTDENVKCYKIMNVHESFGKPVKGSIPTIIRSFKSASTNLCRNKNFNFCWQKNYYERKLKNDHELNIRRAYIKNNPENWVKKINDNTSYGHGMQSPYDNFFI